MKTIRLVCKISAVLLAMMSTNVSAQDGYSWDSVLVKNVQIWYPGPPDSGRIKAELWWHHPPIPYSPPCGNVEMGFRWTDVGATACDSVKRSLVSMLDSVQYTIHVDNLHGYIEVWINKNYDYAFSFRPGQHHIADLYFSVNSPCIFTTDTLYAPYFSNPPSPTSWSGWQFSTANIVADPGDFNGDGTVNISDCVNGIMFVFGPFDDPVPCGDANGSCSTNISDVVYLINYLFSGGPEPEAGCVFWR